MKTFKIFAWAFIAICFASCGSKSNSNDSVELDSINTEEISNTIDEAADEVEDLFSSESSTTDEEDSYASSSDSNSEDWDEYLDSYEKYVDRYISLIKKAQSGDMSALAQYPALLESAQELCDKLNNAKDDMSASQLSRYTKITNKLTKAAANM